MSVDDDSKKSVLWALAGNSTVMCIKFFAAVLTGSSAMLAESLHSAGDVSNQIALFVGIKQGSKKPDRKHPFGYGRARYLLNCVAAGIVAFLAGITLYKGIGTIFHGDVPDYILNSESIIKITAPLFNIEFSITAVMIAFLILGLSFAIEGYTLWIAKKVVWKQKGSSSLIKYIKETSDPTGVAVFLEDFVAELGVGIAIIGIAVTQYLTSNPIFDGIAAVIIAIMMFSIALLLMYINGILLLGKSHLEIENSIRNLIMELPIVERVHRVHTQIWGSNAVSADVWVELREEAIYEHVSNGAAQELIGKSPREVVEVTYNHIASLTDGIKRHIEAYFPEVLYVCIEAETPRRNKDKDVDLGRVRISSDPPGIHAQTV